MKTKLFLILFLTSSIFGFEDDGSIAEIEALVKEYESEKAKIRRDMDSFSADFKPAEETKVKNTPKVVNVTVEVEKEVETSSEKGNFSSSYKTRDEVQKEKSRPQSIEKPDLVETVERLNDGIRPDVKESEAYNYILRWFILADQVKDDDEGTLFYLTKDNDLNRKKVEVEELSMDEETFLPDENLISAIEDEYKKWLSYLKPKIYDLGNIDEKFYAKIDFIVQPKVGLNLRDNPLTGVEENRKIKLSGGNTIRMRYYSLGSGRNFNGTFKERWAKVLVSTRNGNMLGWVDMQYLRK
jgi:hypothetical protein